MNCEETDILLPELLGGALKRETEAEVLSHLAVCSQCREELAFWAKIRQESRAQFAALPPEIRRETGISLQRGTTSSPLLAAAVTLRETAYLTEKAMRLTMVCVRTGLALEGI